jgi:hypothetical protein
MADFAIAANSLQQVETALAEEVSRNDGAEHPPGDWPVAIYPETSGSFQFVQILSQYEGTSVFRASDGLFVLLLSPGDSFSAYEGQSVYLTMHNRGETMSLTVGEAAVFRSGPSPTTMRHFEGFSPDRAREQLFRDKRESLTEQLESSLDSSHSRLEGPYYARIDVRLGLGLSPSRFLVSDRVGPVFCITDQDPSIDCPSGAVEYLSIEDLRSASTRTTLLTQPKATEESVANHNPTSTAVSRTEAASTHHDGPSASPPVQLESTIVSLVPRESQTDAAVEDPEHLAGISARRPEVEEVAPSPLAKSAPPPRCQDLLGRWRFTTTVTQANRASAIGVHGFYELEVESDCRVIVEKTGFSGAGARKFSPEKIQRGTGELKASEGATKWQLETDIGRGSRTDYQMSLTLDFGPSLSGTWRYAGDSYSTTGFEGTLTGSRL